MAKFTTKIDEPHFTNIKNGKKKFEGRVNKGKWYSLRIGDLLEIVSSATGEELHKRVSSLIYHKSFGDLFDIIGIRLWPDAPSSKYVEESYTHLLEQYYTPQEVKDNIKNYGVVGIGFF